jgi:hypothetical protein
MPTSFATPEDAVRGFVAGIAAAVSDQVLAASAIDEPAQHYDFAGDAERLKVMQLSGPAPAQHSFYVDVNRAYFTNRILSQAKILSYSLLSSAATDGKPIVADGPQASAFAAQVDPAGLVGLQVVDVKPVSATVDSDPKYRANATALAQIYGGSNSEQRLALLSLNGKSYEAGFTLIQYGSIWKVLSESASLSTLPATGAAAPITQDEFEQQTSGS